VALKKPEAGEMTITEFRRRYRISNRAWQELADRGDVPLIRTRDRKRGYISEADAEAWAERHMQEWLDAGVPNPGAGERQADG
jgi:hypothetical protein